MRTLLRLTVLGGLGLVVTLLTASATACGCGAVVPRDGDADIAKEVALIRWVDGTEDIVMQLSIVGDSKEAAWILPVPTPATVRLGDPELFDTLEELTRPVKVLNPLGLPFSIGAGAAPEEAAPQVRVLARQTLGPLDVSTLAAQDADALSDWLKSNGYTFPTGLTDVLRPYVEQGWFYVAIKLLPGQTGQTLNGALDPLWLTFESDTILYPMRPSMLASRPFELELYVLAEHKVHRFLQFAEDESDGRWVNSAYSDWIRPEALPDASPLKPFISRELFLTKLTQIPTRLTHELPLNDDYVLTFDTTDQIYRDVERIKSIAGVPNIVWTCCILLLGLLLAFRALRNRKRQAYSRA